MMTVNGAGGLVFNTAGNVLLIRHRNGTWVFPKGHIDEGEQPLEAAVREVEEEAGIEAWVSDTKTTFETSYVNAMGVERNITWFLLETDATEPMMREELFPEGLFTSPFEALGMLSFSEDRRLLRAALAHRNAG